MNSYIIFMLYVVYSMDIKRMKTTEEYENSDKGDESGAFAGTGAGRGGSGSQSTEREDSQKARKISDFFKDPSKLYIQTVVFSIY